MSEIGYSEDIEEVDEYQLTLHYVGKKIDEKQIRNILKSSLPSYFIPTHFVHLEELPLSKNGKIDRKALHQIVQK